MSEVCACKLLDHASLCPGGSSGLLLLQSVAGQQHLALLLLVGLDGTGSLIILSQWGHNTAHWVKVNTVRSSRVNWNKTALLCLVYISIKQDL